MAEGNARVGAGDAPVSRFEEGDLHERRRAEGMNADDGEAEGVRPSTGTSKGRGVAIPPHVDPSASGGVGERAFDEDEDESIRGRLRNLVADVGLLFRYVRAK